MKYDNKIFFGLIVLIVLLVISLSVTVMDYMVVSYREKVFDDYLEKVNISFSSDTDFFEGLVKQNLDFRNRINELEVALAENELLINRLINRYNLTMGINISPFNRIKKDDIQVYNDRIIIYVNKAFTGGFTKSGSMYPFINENVLALEVKPDSPEELGVGDVIGFESNVFNTSIIHRIISIGKDEKGWFAVTKGDNNPAPDPGKVRFGDIIGVLVGLIY